MNRFFTLCTWAFVLLLAASVSSCHKFPGQSVPSYIRIDSISLDCDYYTYGANTSNFTDAWVYIDDQIIGCYELPSTIPVLAKGRHKVTVRAGICINGIGDSRPYYTLVKPTADTLELVENSIVSFNPKVYYFPINEGVQIGWMEDFETTNALVPMSQSDVDMLRVGAEDSHIWYHEPYSFHSGKIQLPPDSLDFYVTTADEFTFYNKNYVEYCVLELDYNCNDAFFVGLSYYENYTISYHPLVQVLPSDNQHDVPNKWKKIYINLGPYMNEHINAEYFKLYLTSNLTVSEGYGQPAYVPLDKPRYYYFDNLKVLYRPQ